MYLEDYLMYGFITLAILLLLSLVPLVYVGSCTQTNVYNKQHNTEYTCGDFFCASSQINQQTQTINIQQLKQ